MLVAVVMGCGPGFDANSGGDNKIAAAKPLPLGRPTTDRVSDRHKDNVDWKVFEFEEVKGLVRVDIYWDEPTIDASVTLRDQFGAVMFEWLHPEGRWHESYRQIRVREGLYYLEFRCKSGDSVYTVEVRDERTGEPGGWGGDDVPPPE